MSNVKDLHFHIQFKSLITVCYEGVLGLVSTYASALNILIDHVVENPTILNRKIFDRDIPSMMLKSCLEADLNSSLKRLF